MATVNSNAIVSFNNFKLGRSKNPFLTFKIANTEIVLVDDGKRLIWSKNQSYFFINKNKTNTKRKWKGNQELE